MGLQRKITALILALLLSSCGASKKRALKHSQSISKERIEQSIKHSQSSTIDTSVTLLNIVRLKVTPKDNGQPIVVEDSNGHRTTFYNADTLTITNDRSVLKKALNASQSIIENNSSEESIKAEEKASTKDKLRIDTTAIYIMACALILAVLYKLRKKLRLF